MKASVLSEPILVGREKELEGLHECLNLAIEGKGITVLVSGEAGSGKTRLTSEFLNAAEKKGMAILAGWCLSNAATPYFPFVEAFNSYFSRFEDEQPIDSQKPGETLSFAGPAQTARVDRGITAWLAGPKKVERLGKPLVVSPEVWKDQVFAGVARTLHEISVQQPIVLFIEDIHWADSASLALLHYVARATKDYERILVLATLRSEELATDVDGRSHPLAETLRLMRREDLFREIELSSLGQDCVNTIAQGMLGKTLDSDLVNRLTEKSRGNPLFVVESLRMWLERGSLVQERGGLRLAVDELDVPSKFKDIILRRLGSLKFGQRRVLDVASVIGEKFDPDLLGFVLGGDSLAVLETLDEVAQSTRLIHSEGDCYSFDHARSREILYQEISSLLKKGYHAKIAQGLETKSKTSEKLPLSSLAYHYAQAGNREKAIQYAVEAGEDALTRFSNSEALKAFRYVLSATEGTSTRTDLRTRALFGLGNALQYTGYMKEAVKTYETLFDFAESGAVKLRALRLAMEFAVLAVGPARVLDLALIAEEYSQFDRLEFARVQKAKARAMSVTGRIEEARRETEKALRVFEEEGSFPDIAAALSLMTGYYARMDKTPLENALATMLHSVSLAEEVGNLRELAVHLGQKALMFLCCGLFEKAYEIYVLSDKTCDKLGLLGFPAMNAFWLGVLFETKGILKEQTGSPAECIEDFKAAISHSLKGVQVAEKTDISHTKMLNYGNLVRQYVKTKEIDKAETFFRKLEETYPEANKFNAESPWDHAQYLRSKAAFFAAKGRWAEANKLLEESLVNFKNFTGLAFPMFIAETRIAYAEALAQQQMSEESKVQLEKANVIIEEFMRCKEKVDCADVRASLITKREVGVDEEFVVRIDLVNAGMNPASVVRLEDIVPSDFKVVNLPPDTRIQNCAIEMNAKIGPFQVEPVRLTLQAQRVGAFTLNPRVIYNDHVGETKTRELSPITITVRPTIHAKIGGETVSVPILPDRLTVGFKDLDVLLYGGIPENYAVVLTSSPSDERESIAQRFLEAGTKAGQPTLCLTTEAGIAKNLAEDYKTTFFLFVCNPRAEVPTHKTNIFRFKGVDNLTEIDIALIKAFRSMGTSYTGPKRAYIDIVSDVLLQNRAVTTRKWLTDLLADLKAKGFTTLAVVNPDMHSQEDVQAILSLFEGEIRISEKETAKTTQKVLRVRKLHRQRYLENELVLNKETFGQ